MKRPARRSGPFAFVAGTGGVVHIAEPHGLRPGRGIGDGGDGEIIFAVRHTGQHGGEIQSGDLQVYAEFVGDVSGHLNVHALILVLPALVGVYIFIGGEIGLGTQLDIAFFLDLRQTVLGLPILAAAAGGAGQCQNSRQQNCHCLFISLPSFLLVLGRWCRPFDGICHNRDDLICQRFSVVIRYQLLSKISTFL